MTNPIPNSKPFVKGDPRINRKGRPSDFDGLRVLAKEIAHEAAISGGQPVIINGHKCTAAEIILRQWAMSKNPILQRAFIEIAFGKVPDKLDVTSAGEKIKGYAVISPDDWTKDADES